MSNQSAPVTLPTALPVSHETEILVAGGGPGGLGAAIAAAREGREVILLEHYGFLGGMATAGEVNPFMPNHIKGESLDQGVYTDWRDRMATYGGLHSDGRTFDPNIARLAAEDLCLEAGVKILYHHRTVHVERDGDSITGVVVHSKSGLTVVRAQVYIDATGDGDLSAQAGAEFEYGGENTGHAQPMTLCFKLKLSPQDLPTAAAGKFDQPGIFWVRKINETIQAAFTNAKAEGRMDCPRENVLMFSGVDPEIIHFNTTRVIHKSAIDGGELSDAEIEGRRQLRQLVQVLRDDIPLFKHARLYSIAPQIGVRESRRILGRSYLTREDFSAARTFADGIARVNYPIDIHSPDGSGTEITQLPKDAWYEIPYGCILPRGIENLLVASRCISVDHAVHSSMRVMPPVCSIGQAAGTAAAMSLAKNILVTELDGVALRERLNQCGRNLPIAEGKTSRADAAPPPDANGKRAATYSA